MDELQVVLPYHRLLALLKASEQVDILSQQLAQVSAQQAALRGQFVELMEKYKELQDFVKD